MGKNLIKIIITIIVIIIIYIIINVTRNYIILNEISDTTIKEQPKNYYFEESIISSNKDAEITSKVEEYSFNGIYLAKTYINNDLNTTIWYDSNTDEGISIDNQTGTQNNEINKSFIEDYKKPLLLDENNKKDRIIQILTQTIFIPIISKDNNYIITNNDGTYYINKNTNLIEQIQSNDTTISYTLKTNIVKAEDVKSPS